MKQKTFMTAVLVLVICLAAAYLATGLLMARRTTVSRSAEALAGSKGATSVISNFQHIESFLDTIGWELSAATAELLENKANLTGIRMKFYTTDKETISIEGKRGTIDLTTKNVIVSGSVEAVYNDLYHFYSEEVSWDAERKVLVSPGAVRIVGPQGEIQGQNLIGRPNKKKFVIKGGVTMDFKGSSSITATHPSGEVS